jgi:hypothetical protein
VAREYRDTAQRAGKEAFGWPSGVREGGEREEGDIDWEERGVEEEIGR